MQTETLIEPETEMDGKLRLFSLHVDYAAAPRADWATSQISRLAGKHWKLSTKTWDLDSLSAGEPIRKTITRDAADADVLIIAMSSLDRRELELVLWLDSLAVRRVNRPGAGLFIGLLGEKDGRTGELYWTVKQLLRCARQMDRDFIWRWMEQGVMNRNNWLADSVKALLNRKQHGSNVTFLQEVAL